MWGKDFQDITRQLSAEVAAGYASAAAIILKEINLEIFDVVAPETTTGTAVDFPYNNKQTGERSRAISDTGSISGCLG